MKNIFAKIIILAGFSLVFSTQALAANELSLQDAFTSLEKTSPALQALKFRAKASEAGVSVAKAGYLPSLSFEAIDSTGFASSSSYLGIGGLMGSPFRSGYAYGLVAKGTLWDFGRTSNNVAVSEKEVDLDKQDTVVQAQNLKVEVLESYYDCAQNNSEKNLWTELVSETQYILKEASHFVKTGQRSIVEKYLINSQMEEALTSKASYGERYKASHERLGILIGKKEFTCPELSSEESPLKMRTNLFENNILVNRTKALADLAEARKERAKSSYLPELIAMGSLGNAEDTRLVGSQQNYSASIGFVFPLFDGKTSAEVERANAQVAQYHQEVASSQQAVDDMNAKFDEVITSEQVKLEHLKKEFAIADEGYKIAKKRYFTLQGTLVDLREALRNWARTKSEIYNSRAALLKATGKKSLLN